MTGVTGPPLMKNLKLTGEILQPGTFWPAEVREPQERQARSQTQKNTQPGKTLEMRRGRMEEEEEEEGGLRVIMITSARRTGRGSWRLSGC